jgi:hypothetical protein
MSKGAKRLASSALLIILTCAAFVAFFGAQTFFAIQARRIGREVPIVNSVPQPLEDSAIAKTAGEKLSFEGVQFDVPWIDLDQVRTRAVGNCALMKFFSRRSVLLCVGHPDMFMKNLFANKQANPELFNEAYGHEVLRSDYDLMSAIYKTTPSSITLSTPSKRAADLVSILLIKAIAPPTTDWAIFDVKSNDFQGFQLGDPSRRPKKMCLQLYSADLELEFSFEQNAAGPFSAITQADLNRIVQTVRKTGIVNPTVEVAHD